MLQVVIDSNLLFDFKNHCEENNIKYTEAVRRLIHTEVYNAQSLLKSTNKGLSQPSSAPRKAGKRDQARGVQRGVKRPDTAIHFSLK